jgi:hypothetical protein
VGWIKRALWRAVRALARLTRLDLDGIVLFESQQFSWGAGYTLRWNLMLLDAWVRNTLHRSRYRVLTEADLRSARRSDTVFVFGSGSSLNEITAAEWDSIREHDVIGFNAFYNQRWVPVDFYLLRGAVYGELRWRRYAEEVRDALRGNPLFERTKYVLQKGFLAQHGNQLVGYGLLPSAAPVARYRTVRGWGPPTRSFSHGLRHAVGTLDDAVNLAYCLGWKEIVLVGVDLYDSTYFWLGPDETLRVDEETGGLRPDPIAARGQRASDPHNTARNGVVRLLGEWREVLERDGVHLSVFNPRSLLAESLPVYTQRVAART